MSSLYSAEAPIGNTVSVHKSNQIKQLISNDSLVFEERGKSGVPGEKSLGAE